MLFRSVLDPSWRLYAVPWRGGPESDVGGSEAVAWPGGKWPCAVGGESKEFLMLRLSILASRPLMRSRISVSVLSFLEDGQLAVYICKPGAWRRRAYFVGWGMR